MTYAHYPTPKGYPLKLWQSEPFTDNAMEQLHQVASMPFIHKHVAGMPDVHLGKGATIGSVIATRKAIIPAAVGVDIGCGMTACKTSLTSNDLPTNLAPLRSAIEAAVPHGRSDNGGVNDFGRHTVLPPAAIKYWDQLSPRYNAIIAKHPKAEAYNTVHHLGTLGTGNHFIELCLDEHDFVWILLHSGSRGPGNRIGMYFIEKAKEEMRRYYIQNLPNPDLAYLVEYTEIFDDYVEAVNWAQEFAKANREVMLQAVNTAMQPFFGMYTQNITAIDCHHNYVTKENHYSENVWVTRKGAVSARKNQLGIIPGSMGTGSFIVEGLGNKDSFCSCSHGAGRVMSRTQAKALITPQQHKTAMQGIEARLDDGVLDESPAAYKDINKVMEAQKDLVSIKFHLKQVLNVKG